MPETIDSTETEPTEKVVQKATSVEAWQRQAVHTVALPSATEVDIVVPNLPAMLKTGQLPNELLDIAVKQQSNKEQEVTAEDVAALADFHRFLVSKTVKNPAIEPEDVDSLPYEDVQMIVEFATRQRDTDALGHHIAGLERTEEWRKFREQQHELARVLGGIGA